MKTFKEFFDERMLAEMGKKRKKPIPTVEPSDKKDVISISPEERAKSGMKDVWKLRSRKHGVHDKGKKGTKASRAERQKNKPRRGIDY